MKKSRLEIKFSLSNQFDFLFGKPYVPKQGEFLLNHSRSALMIAMQSLNLQKNSRVGVMAYNCHTVMNSVWQCGFVPVFVDVTNGLKIDQNHLAHLADSLDALIVTHLFGIVSDVREIRRKYPHLIIIEDCAHAFGIKQIYGDFATFSIGQGKLPSIGDGGILKVKNSAYLHSVEKLVEKLSSSRSPKLLIKLCVKAFLYHPFVYGIMTRYFLKFRSKNKACPVKKEKISLMDRGVSAIYRKELETTPVIIENRLNNIKKISESQQLFYGFNAFMACGIFEYPVEKAKEFVNVDTATHFKHCIDWAKYYGYVEGSCPMAEYLTEHLLVVPTYCRIKTKM